MNLPDPTNLQNYVLAMLAAATVILPVATGFAVKLSGAIAEVRASIDELRSRQEAQSNHLINQSRQIVDIALAAPPPSSSQPPTNNLVPPTSSSK